MHPSNIKPFDNMAEMAEGGIPEQAGIGKHQHRRCGESCQDRSLLRLKLWGTACFRAATLGRSRKAGSARSLASSACRTAQPRRLGENLASDLAHAKAMGVREDQVGRRVPRRLENHCLVGWMDRHLPQGPSRRGCSTSHHPRLHPSEVGMIDVRR